MTDRNEEKTVFEELSKINVANHIDKKVIQFKKGGSMTLSYLSWVWAHNILMQKYGSDYKREWTKFDEISPKTGAMTGRKVDFCYTQFGAYVECTVTIKGNALTETLPVMDARNQSPLNPTMMEINKAKQRCFVKACALHGLGLNLYAGEDLPIGFEPMTEKQEAIIKDYCANIGKLNGKKSGALYKEAILKCKIRDYRNMSKSDADLIIEYLNQTLADETKKNKQAQEKVGNANE